MPASPLIAACDEIVTALNAHDWAGEVTFTAARAYQPVNRLEDLAGLKVEVCLPSRKRERVARGFLADTFRIVVGIQQRLDETNKQADADALMALADEVLDFLSGQEWTFGDLKTVEELPTVHGERYDLDGVFTRAIALTFHRKELTHG